jgi:hypothetical protein
LPQAEALAAYCHECFVNPGEPCTNYKGHAKEPCRLRGHRAQVPTAPPRGLFDAPAEEPAEADQETPPDEPAPAEEPIEPAPGNRWTLHHPLAIPAEIVDLFALDLFGRKRPLLAGGVVGRWNGQRFEGYFHFADGNACYVIECENAVYSIRKE